MKKLMSCLFVACLGLGFVATAQANKPLAPGKLLGVKKCSKSLVVLAKTQLALKSAVAAYDACKAKFKLTHVVRCRALKKALKAAKADVAAAQHRHRICREGCVWLAKNATDAAAAYDACKAKHKWTHRVRCLNKKNAAKAATAQLVACKARK